VLKSFEFRWNSCFSVLKNLFCRNMCAVNFCLFLTNDFLWHETQRFYIMVTLFHIRWKRLELFSSVICMSPWLSKLLRSDISFRFNPYKINVCNSHYRLQSNVAVANIWWFSLWVWIFTSVFFIVTFFLNLLHTRNVSLDCHSVAIDAHRVSWLQPWSATMKCNHVSWLQPWSATMTVL